MAAPDKNDVNLRFNFITVIGHQVTRSFVKLHVGHMVGSKDAMRVLPASVLEVSLRLAFSLRELRVK